MEESYVYHPRIRVLLDLVLGVMVILLFAKMWNLLDDLAVTVGGAVIISCMVSGYFLWFRPTFRIVIKNGKISGPSRIFKRIELPLRKISHTKILRRTPKQKMIGYRNLWSVEGQYVRLWHRLLGKQAVYEIMEIVEKYPFREAWDHKGPSKSKNQDKREESASS